MGDMRIHQEGQQQVHSFRPDQPRGQTGKSRHLQVTDLAIQQASQLQSALELHRASLLRATPEPRAATATASYEWEAYQNNWGAQGALPGGVAGDLGFAVCNADGTLNTSSFPLNVGASTGFAVGGWNDSQGGNLLQIMKKPLNADGSLAPEQAKLLQSIVENAQKYGFQRVTMDFEAYGQNVDPKTYDTFLTQLGKALHGLAPPVQLQMAISPSLENQNYFNLNQLLTGANPPVDKLQVMCYDYAAGQSTVSDNADVDQTKTYLDAMFKNYAAIDPGLLASKLEIGFPLYGTSWQVSPNLSAQEIQAKIKSGTLSGNQETHPSTGGAEFPDDEIKSKIGSWDAPSPPWQKINVPEGSSKSTYYYNPTSGQIISAFPPSSMAALAQMITSDPTLQKVSGFFSWQSQDDQKGDMYKAMMKSVMDLNPPSLQDSEAATLSYLQNLKKQFTPPSANFPPIDDWIKDFQSQSFKSSDELTNWIKGKFYADGSSNDIYMKYPGLLQQNSGKTINLLSAGITGPLEYLQLNSSLSLPPSPTDADLAFTQLSQIPTDKLDQNDLGYLEAVKSEFKEKGSGWSKGDIKQYYWSQVDWHLDDANLKAELTNIMYGNT